MVGWAAAWVRVQGGMNTRLSSPEQSQAAQNIDALRSFCDRTFKQVNRYSWRTQTLQNILSQEHCQDKIIISFVTCSLTCNSHSSTDHCDPSCQPGSMHPHVLTDHNLSNHEGARIASIDSQIREFCTFFCRSRASIFFQPDCFLNLGSCPQGGKPR